MPFKIISFIPPYLEHWYMLVNYISEKYNTAVNNEINHDIKIAHSS